MRTQEGGESQFFSCRCFSSDNIFLSRYGLHARFESVAQFKRDYRQLLGRLGCATDQQFEDVIRESIRTGTRGLEQSRTEKGGHALTVSQEVDRRERLSVTSAERAAVIRETYQPLHPHVYHLRESYLHPQFRQMVEYCCSSGASEQGLLAVLGEEPAQRVYRLPVFEKSFCEQLLEELEHFEKSAAPKGRPNTMNHHGVLLNELGFDECFFTPLRERYLRPLTSLLYPDCGGGGLDSHKAFVVKYNMNEDLELSYHYDNSEVTLNVSLGKDFTEGNLYFGNMRQVPLSDSECSEVEHRVTEGLLHRGQHMHGALPISSGQRWNLIVWMRASQERNRLCPMCNRKPTLVEGVGFADGFTRCSDAALSTSCVLA